jgi:hypothetical protein
LESSFTRYRGSRRSDSDYLGCIAGGGQVAPVRDSGIIRGELGPVPCFEDRLVMDSVGAALEQDFGPILVVREPVLEVFAMLPPQRSRDGCLRIMTA